MILRSLLFLVMAVTLHAQGLDYVRAHYTKYEYLIPMRDGVKLFTSVYTPKDQSKSYPFLIYRSPYSIAPYGPMRGTNTVRFRANAPYQIHFQGDPYAQF